MSAPDPGRELATLLQLMRRAREADSEEALGFVLVNESLRLLPYRQAALWRDGALGRVSALSGVPEADSNAPYVQWLGSLFRWQRRRVESAPISPLCVADLDADLAEDWPQWLPPHALYLRLDPPGTRLSGALLLARDAPWSARELALATELAHAYAHAQARFAPQRHWRDRLGDWARPGKTRRRVLLGLLLVLCLPLRLSVLAKGEVQPMNPLLVRAPLSGVIDRVEVQPNARVEAGAALFNLDATVLASQQALVSKEREAASESYRQSAQLAVTDDKGKLEMTLNKARLEEKSIEADFSARQLSRIHVRAPRAGVVVFSDPNNWMGKAVAAGEKVMTLADPSQLELSAYLPAAEAIRIELGGELKLYPSASPTESYDATITRIAYRAEVTEDGILAYRIQARFTPGDTPPRLGQTGTVRVYGDWVPLGYYALRRPLAGLRQWLGW